ncbi:ABC transporter ATP-binding protein [Ruminococcus gauvreauii]|uniref:ABC transporter ATP-binding protein n=1 Tax=Ruminococcus gauvreauii TaxID=438033 RepID=UPI003983E715
MTDMLRIEGLSKSFSDFALQNISFSIPQGCIMGLIGPNGSGKTTTIRLILNLLKKQEGTISVLGLDHIKEEQSLKERIGVVFDSHFFVDEWNMSDVEYAMSMFYKRWNTETYDQKLRQFQISRNRRVKELSKGMQMKLMLACAFSHGAEFLILDEPTSGLDPVSRDELLDILLDYTGNGKYSVLFSTHITPDLAKAADSITFINKGKMLFTGKKEELTEKFFMITGCITELTPEVQSAAQSIKKYPDHFEALILRDQIHQLSGYVFRPAAIDDIIVLTNRGGNEDGKNL